jgi:hypothetical protein
MKLQQAPIDRDLAAADAEKAAEIDDGGTRLPLAVDEDIHHATHVLPGGALHLLAEDGRRLAGKDRL